MPAGAFRRALLKGELALREIVALSPRTMRAITANSVRMSIQDRDSRRARRAANDQRPVTVGSFTGAQRDHGGEGLAATFDRATLHIRAISDDLVRLAWGPGPAPIDVATRDAEIAPPSSVDVRVVEGSATLTTPHLSVEVSDHGVVVTDARGNVRYEELTPLFEDARRVLRRVLREGERLAGLGEQAQGLDLTGGTYRLWNRDPGGAWGPGQNPLYCSIPVTIGLHEHGPVWAFHENTYDATVEVGQVAHAPHGVTATFDGGQLVTYVAVGELDGLLTTAARLTGFPPMPPRWALGYHHCRWGWRTDRIVAGVLAGFVSRGIPLSALHLDIDHMDDFRVFTFDEVRFGGVGDLARRALEHGSRLVAIVDPAVRRDDGFPLYAEGVSEGHFVTERDGQVHHGTVWPGWAAFPDFTRAATRAWWATKYEALTSKGVAGVWHDMNEPTSITLWGDRTLPRSTSFDLEGRGGDHGEAHNIYGLLMDKAGYEALSGPGATARPFVLSRSGWAGMQRYAWHWTADVESSQEGLSQQVPTFLGLGMSSVAFTGSDIGGFSGIPSPGLFVRWLELGVVSPLCRTHCVLGAPDREPWRFDALHERAITGLIRMRYRLLPHLYRLAEEAHRLGHPILRVVDWPREGAISGATADAGAFLLGDELLVVPVSDPDTTQVTATIPAGRWRRQRLCPIPGGVEQPPETDEEGGRVAVLDAPLGQPVILQRAGSIVVLDDAWSDASTILREDHAPALWTLHVVLDASGSASGRGFDDLGDGDGATRHDTYRADTHDATVTVRWDATGSHPKPVDAAVVVHGRRFGSANADGSTVPCEVSALGTRVLVQGGFDQLELR
jgi:alpha-glucosidase